MQNIPNRVCEDKRRHAQALPENGALHSQKVELAHKWMTRFDQYTKGAYDRAIYDVHTLERLAQQAAPQAIQTAQELDVLGSFPFASSHLGRSTPLDEMTARADVLAVEMNTALRASTNILDVFPLLRFLALRLLQSEHTLFSELLKEAAFYARGDENAYNDTAMFHSLFEMWLEHSGRADELKADGLIISDVLPDCKPVERTPAHFAEIFEEDFVNLFEAKQRRLGAVNWTIPHHTRPCITEEEVKEDHTLGLVLRHWERTHAPILAALQKEKAELEEWFATEHLELVFYWAMDVQWGLDDCNCARPSIARMLDHWKQEGLASDKITVEAIWEELFKTEEE